MELHEELLAGLQLWWCRIKEQQSSSTETAGSWADACRALGGLAFRELRWVQAWSTEGLRGWWDDWTRGIGGKLQPAEKEREAA